MEKKELTVSEKLDKVLEGLEKQETKKFRLPFGIKAKKGRIKKNYALVQILRTNGSVNFIMAPIEDNTIKIGDVYHEATAKYIMRYKKYPMLIIPEWNISPISSEDEAFSPQKNLENAVKEGKLSAAEKFILHAIKMDLVKAKSKLSIGIILIILAALGGGLVLLNQLGVLK